MKISKGETRGNVGGLDSAERKPNRAVTAAQVEKLKRGELPNREFRRFLKKLKREKGKARGHRPR
jgi:hypothetical protein